MMVHMGIRILLLHLFNLCEAKTEFAVVGCSDNDLYSSHDLLPCFQINAHAQVSLHAEFDG